MIIRSIVVVLIVVGFVPALAMYGGCVSWDAQPSVRQKATSGPTGQMTPTNQGLIQASKQTTRSYGAGDPWPFRLMAIGVGLLPVAAIIIYLARKLHQSRPCSQETS